MRRTTWEHLERIGSNAPYYAPPSFRQRMAGGVFKTCWPNGAYSVFAKTKTGVLYRFSDFDRQWHRVGCKSTTT